MRTAVTGRAKVKSGLSRNILAGLGPYGGDARSVQTRVERGRKILDAYEATVDARYLPTRGFITLMGAIGLEPAADAFRYHDADVDIVPRDRLGGAAQPEPVTPAPAPWEAP